MSFEVLAYADRTGEYNGELTQKDRTPYLLGPFDRLRFKMGRGVDPLVIDILSGAPSVNGSFINITSRGQMGPPMIPAMYQLQIAQGDIVGLEPGTYDGEISVVLAQTGLDDLAEQGCIDVISTLGGNIGYS